MNKLLLALGVFATLAAPAVAGGRLDANPSILINPSQIARVPAAETGLTATRAAQVRDDVNGRPAEVEDPFDHGDLFGPDSR